MKRLILAIYILMSYNLVAQTKVISHKSHSGHMSEFKTNLSEDNFGLPSNKIDSVRKISSDTVIEYSKYSLPDTITDHPYLKLTYNELKVKYPKIKFLGFETKDKHGKSDKSTYLIISVLILSIFMCYYIYRNSISGL